MSESYRVRRDVCDFARENRVRTAIIVVLDGAGVGGARQAGVDGRAEVGFLGCCGWRTGVLAGAGVRSVGSLKDRFGSEIRTHYPREMAAEIRLIAHEADLAAIGAEVGEPLLEVLAAPGEV